MANNGTMLFDLNLMMTIIFLGFFISFGLMIIPMMILHESTPSNDIEIVAKIDQVLKQNYEFEDILISPDTPFGNKRHWIEIIDVSKDYIHILDKYFDEKGLLLLYDGFNLSRNSAINTIKILTSPFVTSENLRESFKKFKKEFQNKNIVVSMRVMCDSKLLGTTHHRYIISSNLTFDVPSPQQIVSGQMSTIKKVDLNIPFDDYWEKSLDIIDNWQDIKKFLKSESEKAETKEEKIKPKTKEISKNNGKKLNQKVEGITQIRGEWDFSKWEVGQTQVIYVEPFVKELPGTDPRNVAIALFEKEMERGIIRAKVKFTEGGSSIARIIIGCDPEVSGYYSVGIGGYKIAYLIDRFDINIGWRAIYSKGDRSQIKQNKLYQIEVEFDNQTIILRIDNEEIFNYKLLTPNKGSKIGLFSWGKGNVIFSDIELIRK